MPQHIHGLHQVKINQPTALSIGVFDGVHLGHQQLIRNLVAVARARSLLSAVLSFHPHPDILLRGKQGRFYLSRIEDRIRHLQELGVELVITHPFDETIRQKSAEEFVSDLCTRLQLAALIQGEGFALGHRRQGDIPFLVYMGKSWGYEVFTERISKIGDVIISSQSIRAALAAGSVGFVRDRLLGKAYTLRGPIVRGYQRGRQLGFPTANLGVWEEQLLPANGIYAGWATVKGERVMALTNLGSRPSFAEDAITVEAYLVDFDQDIYGEEMSLSFEKFLRPEQRFANIDALKLQIASDVRIGKRYLQTLAWVT